MASLSLSSSASMKLEPFKKSRWIMQINDIGPSASSIKAAPLAFVAHTATVPNFEVTVNDMNRINEKFYVAGKPGRNDLSCGFYDYLTKDENSAAIILRNWAYSIYDPRTGKMGFKANYAANATLVQLDPAGNIARTWYIYSLWPSAVTFGDALSYDDDALIDIVATFKYDLAVLATGNYQGVEGYKGDLTLD